MRVVPCFLVGALCLGVVGCSTFGRKSPTAPNAPARPAPDARRSDPPPSPTPVADTAPPPPASVGGLLAGQVLDRSDRPAVTYIQVSEAGLPSAGAPIEVVADNQGYFSIQGLQPGRSYQLIARARSGDRILAGATVATAPNARILIRITSEYPAPALPSPAVYPGPPAPSPPPAPSWPERSPAADQAWAPGAGTAADPNRGSWGGSPSPYPPRRAAELGPPVGMGASVPPPGYGAGPQGPVSSPAPVPTPRPQDIVRQPEPRTDPLIYMQGPQANGGTGNPGAVVVPRPPVAGSASRSGLDSWEPPAPPAELAPGPARVPSCDLVGLTLHNFALYDINGQPWEFRQRYGKLVLLDFWGTWCIPCLHAVPHLKDMQLRYGPYGLQVVGIAYEEGTAQQQVEKINRVRTRLQMNYLVLRGAERSQCPVCTQFQVRQWPTLVLVDERGRIIWRGEGVDAQKLKDLEIVIRQRLNLR